MLKHIGILLMVGLMSSCLKNESLVGHYQTASTDSICRGYYQSLDIGKLGSSYTISFSGSLVKGEPGCEYQGSGIRKKDTIEVNIPYKGDLAKMLIYPTKDHLGMQVGVRNEKNRHALMYYCSGGSSLIASYYNNIIGDSTLGNINKSMNLRFLKKMLPKKQFVPTHNSLFPNKLKSYKVLDEDQNPLLCLAFNDKGRLVEAQVLNLMYQSTKKVGLYSKFREIKEAYPNATVIHENGKTSINTEHLSFIFEDNNSKSIEDSKAKILIWKS